MGLRKGPGHGWTDDDKTPALRMCRSRRSIWLQGTLRMGSWDKTPSIMPLCWKVAPPFGSSLLASALPACLLPWLLPWLSPHPLALALLPSAPFSSATSQLHPSAGPQPLPSFSLPPRLHSLHCTQGSQPPVCISTLQVFFPWTCCSFLPHLHWWSDKFPSWEATGVFRGGSCARESSQESKAQAWETWMHQQWASATLLYSTVGCPKAA